jgi:hypothetical protein
MASFNIKPVTNGLSFAGTMSQSMPLPATASKGMIVKANTKAIKIGDLVIVDGSNAGYVTTIADSAQASSDNVLIGIAAGDSTQTASVDGEVVVTIPVGTGLYCKIGALTKGSLAASQLYLNRTIDVSAAGVATFDQGTATKGIAKLLGYNSTTGECEVFLRCNFWTA